MTHEDHTAVVRELLDLNVVSGRYSSRLVEQLARCIKERSANVFTIFAEIAWLEGARNARPTRTKPPAQFTGSILRGLWHKHHLQASFIPQNVLNHWARRNFDARVQAILQDQTIPEANKIAAAIHAFVIEGYTNRSGAAEITGEWIVYARQGNTNYYLTIGKHSDGDNAILSRVRACCDEFPHLDICK